MWDIFPLAELILVWNQQLHIQASNEGTVTEDSMLQGRSKHFLGRWTQIINGGSLGPPPGGWN